MKRATMVAVIFMMAARPAWAATHRITVVVQTVASAPISDVPVELLTASGSLLQRKISSSAGQVKFSTVPDGEYVVVPRSKGYIFTPVQQFVTLTPTSGDVTLSQFVGEPTLILGRSVVPGVIEFEHFDDGAQGVAYSDTTLANKGGKYRESRVDIERSTDQGGGYDVYLTAAGEWLKFSITAPTGGEYRTELRVGLSPTAQGSVTVAFDNDAAKTFSAVIPKGSTGPTAWRTIPIPGTMMLSPGDHEVKVTFQFGTSGAKFNHFTVTSAWSAAPVPSTVVNVSGLVAGEVDDVTAISNGQRIQQAIEALPSAGGVVQLPEGIFFVRQATPVEGQFVGSEVNAVAYVGRGDFVLRGAGAGRTVLIAKNRATSFLHIGNRYEHDGLGVDIRNIEIQGITFQSRPFTAPDGSINLQGFTNRGCQGQIDCNVTLGGQVTVFGDSPQEWITNLSVHDCEFLNLQTLGIHLIHVKGARISNNRFVFFSTGIPSAYQALDSANPKVGIFAGALRVEDIEVVGNTFTGNGDMTSSTDRAADGLVWLSQGGNWLVSDNRIENYQFEGVQLNAGPGVVARNQFVTRSGSLSSVAVAVNHSNASGSALSSAASLYSAFSIAGNTVDGGQGGVLAQPPQNPNLPFNAAFDVSVTGNTFLLIDRSGTAIDPGFGMIIGYARRALVAGNTVRRSARAIHFATFNGRPPSVAADLQIRCNDFQGLLWQSFLSQEYDLPAIQQLLFVANILSRGNGGFAHLQFDNVYAGANGIVTRLKGSGNHFLNTSTGELESRAIRYYNNPPGAPVVSEDLRDDEAVFALF